jgi:hypothetical protein
VTSWLEPGPQADQTTVMMQAEITLVGAAAQMSRGLLSEISKKLTQQFADCLEAAMAAQGAAAAAPPDARPPGPRRPPPVAVAARPVGGIGLALSAIWQLIKGVLPPARRPTRLIGPLRGIVERANTIGSREEERSKPVVVDATGDRLDVTPTILADRSSALTIAAFGQERRKSLADLPEREPVSERLRVGTRLEQRPFGVLEPPEGGERPPAQQQRLGDERADPEPAQAFDHRVGRLDRFVVVAAGEREPRASERPPQ